jgi:hypothetical protein
MYYGIRLQCLIWMEFFEPLWKNRNNLLHHTVNLYTQDDSSKLAESITWYCDNRHLLLATRVPRHIPGKQHRPHHPPDNAHQSLTRMVSHVEIAKDAYEKE